ncbi:MAG TPA: DUF2894 domain-containing protein [Trinickia sp.]|nr:DUF2894 domain-containing protein [Trinickia sp.]
MTQGADGAGAADTTADTTADALATLDAWRASGADRVNRARFRSIEALARRAADYGGEVRGVLDERLATLIAAYSDEVRRIEAGNGADAADIRGEGQDNAPATADCPPTQPTPSRGPLAELADLLASRAAAATQHEASTARDALPSHRHERSPDLPMLDYFRETWSKFSAEKQLRHSREQVPDNAGPLNTNSLVHRSLSLMRECSAGYLQQFLSYVEALSWMERLAGPAAVPSASTTVEPPRAGTAKKSARRKPR